MFGILCIIVSFRLFQTRVAVHSSTFRMVCFFWGGSCKREKRMASKGRSGEKEKGQLFWFGTPGGKKGASPLNFETQFYQNACSLCLALLHFQISLFRLEIEVY